jgi:hypothetical protein
MPIVLTSPSTGQVLKFNGTSWVNDSDSGITGSGSAGQVAYFTGATTQAGSNNLFWDNTNGRLGIGTVSPSQSLHVVGLARVISGTNDVIINPIASYVGGAGNQPTIQVVSNNSLQFATNNQLRLSIDNTGKIFMPQDVTKDKFLLFTNGAANEYGFGISAGFLDIYTSNTGGITFNRRNGATFTENARFHSTGNFGINTGATDSGEKLQVTGTAKITGNLTVDTNTLFVNATNKRVGISVTPLYKLHVRPVANANFGVRNAADFNASFTGTAIGSFNDANNANTNLYLESSQLGLNLQSAQNVLVGGNLGIAMTPSYKLDVTGSARISDAIAIGTTPDTNNPFKILKNINSTVGIRFENTNTSSNAFSAVQLGTDITGGTKFTNLVYSSSGVVATGVYNPDGTSLINNGSGGLNFLGTPFRIYTGTGNGTLRILFDNEGTTQFTATTPTTNATDGYKQYSADVTAGNAAPHFRTENGAVIKLYQETTAVGNSIISLGGGNAVLDDTTFDGYTLRQIVKALRNQGILA